MRDEGPRAGNSATEFAVDRIWMGDGIVTRSMGHEVSPGDG